MDEVDIRVRRCLERLGVDYELVPCDPELADTATFCAAYHYEVGDSANTIVVKSRGEPPRFAACVVLATTRLDVNGLVRRRLGRKASFADGPAMAEVTGMVAGGVTPFGLPPELPLWIDRRVMERDRVVLGGGSRRYKLIAAPELLTRLPGAEVVEGLALSLAPA